MPFERPVRDGRGTSFELIETLRFEHGAFVRQERHLARLEGSAKALGFGYDRNAVLAALDTVRDGAPIQRVRLTMDKTGVATVTSAPFTPLPPNAVWRLAVATSPLDSSDQLLRHKTSRRDVYDKARAEFAVDDAHEVLLLNERGEICEGTITTVFVDFGDGVLVTPPLSSGLLAGVLRAELLDEGKAVEAVLAPEMLASATSIHVGNSLRGLIVAQLPDH